MGYFKWLIAGLVGGAVGGVIWVLVGYFGHAEVGYIAWAVGLLAGLAVRYAAGDVEGVGPGVAATAAAVICVLAAKFAVAHLVTNQLLDVGLTMQMTEVEQIALLADEIIEQREAQGETITLPERADEDELVEVSAADYPAEIWADATQRWNALTPAERMERDETARRERAAGVAAARDAVRDQIFKASFSGWDLLWFGLAAFTAFKVGSGAQTDS